MPRKQQFSHLPIKKTSQQNEKLRHEDKFIGVTDTPLIKEQHLLVSKRLSKLCQVIFRFGWIWNQASSSETVCLRNYLQKYYQYYQLDQFDSEFQTLPNLDVNLYTVSDIDKIYKSYNIFHNCQFPVRFHSKFVSKATTYSDNQIKYILAFIMLLAQGHFYGRNFIKKDGQNGQYGFVCPINAKSFPFNRFFYIKIFRQKNVLFNVGVEKKPIVRSGVIKRYEYTQYIQILDILSDIITENPQKLQETVQRFMQGLQTDVAKKDHGQQLVIDDKSKSKKLKIDYLFEQYENPYLGQNQIFATQFISERKYDYRQIIFKPFYVSMGDVSTLIFDKSLKRWVASDYVSNMEQKLMNQYQRKVNEELIKRFVDFQSAKTLVELLTKIPNFRVQLTQQQKDVIGENGNVLVIGRSGTGKTTCAVLRLFAIEMLFKIRLSLSKKKHQDKLKDTRCSADDIDKTMGLHCVFLTASPVLTNQIERYYKKLTENIKTELEKKKKRQQQQKKKQQEQQKSMKKKQKVHEEEADEIQQLSVQQQQIKQKDEDIEVPEKLQIKKSQDVLEQQQEMNKQLGGIQLQQKLQNQKFQEDEENFDQMRDKLEQKMKKFKSLADLREEDYPGFFTVKSFIMMIDGTLAKPFFIRKNQTNEEEQQATWHNQKKGVMMIENYYRNDEEQNKDEMIEEAEIEEEINYQDEEQLQHEYLRQIQLRENKEKQKLTDKLKKNKKSLSFEVDYDYFYTYFWPNVRHKHYSAKNITPHLVWTEIYSTIKGSASAHLYPGLYLPEKVYIASSSNAFLTKQQKLDVYETFCQFERWKVNNCAYDLMDAVNYMLNFIRFRGYHGPEIHYVMIDEVQDLPHSIVYLLSKTVRYGVFYSGDTAQTIAKGVGFRFCDLKNLFDSKQFDYSLQLNKPIVKQLTVNFRSHNNILQLANSVVSSIQILFPKTIDRLKKEVSNLLGPKPIILPQGQQELLFFVLCGDEGYKRNSENTQGFKKPPLQFGCDQVIIVRDQQSKNRIPNMLQHALCLTIYQAKGLEFNDVILFNFFTQSKCADKWNLLKFLRVVVSQIDAQEYEKSVTKHIKQKERKQETVKAEEQKMEEEPQEIDVQCIVDKKDNKVQVKKIISDAKIILKDINDYAELCSELKMLYTAITRPKNTLIIYDEDSTARKTIEKLWEKLEVVEMITSQLLEQSNKKHKPETEQMKIFKTIVNSTSPNEWKRQGLKMYSRGFFQQAMKCFIKSGHQDLYKKAQANNIADHATKKLIQIQSQRQAITNKLIQYQKMSESDLSKLKKKLKKEQNQTFINFQEAAKIFQNLLMFKQAGQCYFSGRKYQNAYENFSKAFMNKQAGESLEMLNKYRQAAEHYEKQGLYLKVIQCLDLVNQWQTILKIIQKFSSQMSEIERKSLLKKYSALALQQLVYEIQFENEPEQNKPENNRVQIIKEQEDSQQQDWDSDQDPQIAAQRSLSRKSKDQNFASRKFSNMSQEEICRKVSAVQSQPMRKDSLIEQDKVIKQSVYENVENERDEEKKENVPKIQQEASKIQNSKADQSSFADLNQSSQQSSRVQQAPTQPDQIIQSIYEPPATTIIVAQSNPVPPTQSQASQNSFAQLNQSSQSSFADLNSYSSSNNDINTKYPTQLQPDIESIRSLADPEDPWIQSALSQIPAKTNTQYSVIDQDQNYNPNARIIKTKGNIVVQDQIMRKIVAIVSIVNQSVQEFFSQFKGYQSLITISKTNDQHPDTRPQISQFEQIDPKFINIILDTLQSFKLYKLCLFVCNRYHLPHKAGRYLVSMALKYSTNAQINNNLNPALIAPSVNRKNQLEKGILASIALHAMFQNVSPDFLKVKVDGRGDAKYSLGAYFIQGLILEGLYKKAVFMVNPQQSLKILKNFSDSPTYQSLYTNKFLKKPVTQTPSFLPVAPTAQTSQQEYTIMKLQQILHFYTIVNRFDTVSQRYYKQFDVNQSITRLADVQKENISYVALLKAMFCKDYGKIRAVLANNAGKFSEVLNSGVSYKIYEIVTFLTTAIRQQSLYQPIFSQSHTAFLSILHTLRTIRIILHKQHHKQSLKIIQSVFSVFNCRLLQPCKSMKFINDGFSLIHRTSTLCNQFVQELKKNPNQIACFFQQDYNYILVKTSKLLDVIGKKFQQAYGRFLRARVEYVGEFGNGFMYQDFMEQQSQYLLKALIRQQLKQMYPKQRKTSKKQSQTTKKQSRPAFNYKTQGRPELVVDLQSSQQDSNTEQAEKKTKFEITNYFIYSDLNENFKYFSDLAITAFYDKISHNNGKVVSGRLLYSAGFNDSYKEFVKKRGNCQIYDAVEFRKFWRLDLYAENLLLVISELSYGERQVLSAEVLIHLLVQYKCFVNGKNFKLDIPRRFLKFFPSLTLIQTISSPQLPNQSQINHHLHQKQHVCIFSYKNKYSSQFQEAEQISDLICQFFDILKAEESYKCFNIQKFILLFVVNLPHDKKIAQAVREFIEVVGGDWMHPVLNKLRAASDYDSFVSIRDKVLADKQLMKNSQMLHQVRVQDVSDIQTVINESQSDYEIKQKILQGRAKAVAKISAWWRTVKKKQRPSDQIQIVKQNRMIKMTHNIKYSPIDDRFILRSSAIRDSVLSFYLRNIVISSLDFHFILMTLNKIQDLRQLYIKAYSMYGQGMIQMQQKQTDFQQQISGIESTVNVWRSDQKWIKDRNIDLRRKKVFEVKWMTKSNIHKIVKKRAGLHKQKKLEDKKKILKKLQM